MRRRRKYFIGELDPCASIEFSRGCPWDCSFCPAWIFYGRAYRKASPLAAAAELASIAEPNVFIVDDVAFIRPEHGHAIAAGVERLGVRKRYYLETRSDVLLRNTDVFEKWTRLGLRYMFLGMEAIDAEGLELYRKRVSPDDNFRALEVARRLGITVAINLIVDPAWDAEQFRTVREFALAVPEIVHLTVMTPYPGTGIWHTESRRLTTRDYRLFDIQHAVVPTTLPLDEFYRELVATQAVINRKHLGARTAIGAARILARNLRHGQTNFARMLWKFNTVYNASRQYADHQRPVRYELPMPPQADITDRRQLYIHPRPPATHANPAAALIMTSGYRNVLVVALALSAGAVDAATYMRLGKVFSSVITGNLALLGVSAGQHDATLALNAGLALAGYGFGVLVGSPIAGTAQQDQPVWPVRVTVTLTAEFVLLAAFSGLWLSSGSHRGFAARLILMLLAATAMGMQSTAVRRLGQMSTTYVTSTLTGILEAIAVRRLPSQWQRSSGILLAMVAGAALSALAVARSPAWAPAVVLAPLAAVIVGSLSSSSR